MSVTYAAFPESEHRERLARARKILQQNDIKCCISVAPEHLYYFAGSDSWVCVNSPQALIFRADGGEPTLVVRDVDLALPRETSWVSDVRRYHLLSDDVPALIASVAREKGLASGMVAVETQSYALPYALGQAFARALAPAAVVDTTDLMGATRLIKSAREMDYLRQAARYAQSGLDAARRALKPGITEIALAAAVEGGMRIAGSDYWSIPTELASGPRRTAGGHATARERVIKIRRPGASGVRWRASPLSTQQPSIPLPWDNRASARERSTVCVGPHSQLGWRPSDQACRSLLSRRRRSSLCALSGLREPR